MIYLFENYNNNASIVYDETTISEETKTRGIAREVLPIPEQNGLMPVLKCSKERNEVWYEYMEYPKEVQLEDLKQQVADINVALAEMMGV